MNELNETKDTALVASTGVCNVINDLTERYLKVSDTDEHAEEKRNCYIAQISELCDKSKGMMDMVAKLGVAEKDSETKLKVAEIDANTRSSVAELDSSTKIKVAKMDTDAKIKLASIDSDLRFNISKAESEVKLACCEAECNSKKDISNAEIKQKQQEMLLSMANAGINAAIAAGTLHAAKGIITTAFVHEIGDNQIIGRATGTRIANSVSTGVISHVLRNCIRLF